MNKRSIKKIVRAERVNMGGHLLDQPLPVRGMEQVDPFLLIHHWDKPLDAGRSQKEVGVGPHPHRGFSPVTFVFRGSVHHRDSMGNDAVVSAGGTQWMHAGRGITHSERPGAEMLESGGDQEFIQFWVNTPAAYKMEPPYYLPISAEQTPTVRASDYQLGIVAGKYGDHIGPAKTYSPQLLIRGNSHAGAEFNIEVPTHFNTILYLLRGALQIDGKTLKRKNMALFNNDHEQIAITSLEDSQFILLSGEPIGEKVASYGPFVMNTQTEIMEAIRDAQQGKMGVLIEEF